MKVHSAWNGNQQGLNHWSKSKMQTWKSQTTSSEQSAISIQFVEKVMFKHFNIHHNEYKILLDYQSAYWENYSTEITLLKLTNDILWAMERQQIMAVTCMDLSAAFDMVDHNIFLHILNKVFGIMDTALKWFECYLRPRNFRVSVNGKTSAGERTFLQCTSGGLLLVLPSLMPILAH